MTDWILRALGADVDDPGAIVDVSLRWQGGVWGMAVVALVVVLALLAWLLYRLSPRDVKPRRRWFLTGLRLVFLGLLAVLLLRPVLTLSLERRIERTLPVLVDATGSMAIADGGADRRIDRLRDALASGPGAEAIAALEADLDVPRYRFSEDALGTIDSWQELAAEGEFTALGDALRRVLDRHRSSSLAGIVVLSDGGQNRGEPLSETAAVLQEAGVPVFVVGVGETDSRDVAVEALESPAVLLADDAAPVSVRLHAQGMNGGGGTLSITLDGVEVASEEVVFEEDGTKQVESLFIPKRPGEYTLQARFEPAEGGEALPDNNQARAMVRVVDRRLKVLLVDQSPRWEYKYLEAMLLRERRVELSCFLFEGDPEAARSPGSPHLERFPFRPADLFDYDLVILGDVAPRFLTPEHQGLLRDYVAGAGGALVVVAGKRFTPAAYAHTSFGKILPVEVPGGSTAGRERPATNPVRLSLTPAGEASTMLQLGDDPDASAAMWRRLPPIYWTARVEAAKPAAEVLLTRPDPLGGSDDQPVLALHRYGSGEVLFVGTDNFWRWRRNTGDRHHSTLWGQIIQRMAGKRLLTGSPRVQLQAEQRSYRRGERVRLYARLFTREWEPRSESVVPAVLNATDDSGRRRDVMLQAVPGQAGLYRAEFAADEAGEYRLTLPGEDATGLDLAVRDENRELQQAGMSGTLLRELAKRTGGSFLRLDELEKLPAAITKRTTTVTKPLEVALWASPLVFGLLILIVTTEWVMRKLSELK